MKHPLHLLFAIPAIAGLGAALAACTTVPAADGAARGKALAQQRCAACHAVAAHDLSPNPDAPPFPAIANQAGLTRVTLHDFLKDSHNYPAAMNFTLDDAAVDDLAQYMVTLQQPDYHPPI